MELKCKQTNASYFNRYKDKFKKIAINALRGIDFFKDKIFDDDFIESIYYDLDYVNYSEGSKLFSEGDKWENIKIILGGNVDILMNRNNRDIYCDTLYCGWSIGTYSFLSNNKYNIRGEATSDILVLILTKDIIEKYFKLNQELKILLIEFDKYVSSEGVPFLDYKLFRPQTTDFHVFNKFQSVTKRLIRINKSYKFPTSSNINSREMMAEHMK